jgi:hypothetical protein
MLSKAKHLAIERARALCCGNHEFTDRILRFTLFRSE